VTTLAVYDYTPRDLAQLDPDRRVIIGYLAQFRTDATQKAYQLDLKHWLAWLSERNLPLLQVTRTDLDMYVHWMQTHPAGWSESTIARRLGTVCGLYKWATDEDVIVKNPAARVHRPGVDHAKQRCTFLPPVEFATLIKHTNRTGTVMEQAYIAILGLRGLRIAEACSLNVEDYQEHRGHRTLRFIGKGNVARLVSVPAPAVRAIDRAIGDRTTGPILLNEAGNRFTRANGARMLKRLAKAAGVDDDISNHSLRRSFVTAAKASGESYDDIAETVGHKSTGTTKRYDKLIGSLDRDISHGVAGFLSNMAG
jgi:site-specific recombinase XerD